LQSYALQVYKTQFNNTSDTDCILDSGDLAHSDNEAATTGDTLDFEPKLRTHHAGKMDRRRWFYNEMTKITISNQSR
jgi:hypothetical protein